MNSFPDQLDNGRLSNYDQVPDDLLTKLDQGRYACDGDQFCETLQTNYVECVPTEKCKFPETRPILMKLTDFLAPYVVISLVVLVISLLISAVVGVIYKCHQDKRGLQMKQKQNKEKVSKKNTDEARLIASPSTTSPAPESTYDTFND